MRERAKGSTRRGFLGGVLGVAGLGLGATLTGCDLLGGNAAGPEPPPPGLVSLLAATGALADGYDATITTVPTLSDQLTPVRDAHRAHARALAQLLGAPSPEPGAGGLVPPDPQVALAALLTSEKAARDDAFTECLEAPARYAPLVGSIAAARASHIEVLS